MAISCKQTEVMCTCQSHLSPNAFFVSFMSFLPHETFAKPFFSGSSSYLALFVHTWCILHPISFSYCPVLQKRIHPLYETVCSSARLFKHSLPNSHFPLIGQLTHAWSSTTNNTNRAAVVDQFLRARPAARPTLCKWQTWWLDMVMWCDVTKSQK